MSRRADADLRGWPAACEAANGLSSSAIKFGKSFCS